MTLQDARARAYDVDTIVVDVEESGPGPALYPDDDEDEDEDMRIQLLGPDGKWHRAVGTFDSFACTGAPRLATTPHRPNVHPSTEASLLCCLCFTPMERDQAAEHDREIEAQHQADYQRIFGRPAIPKPPRK